MTKWCVGTRQSPVNDAKIIQHIILAKLMCQSLNRQNLIVSLSFHMFCFKKSPEFVENVTSTGDPRGYNGTALTSLRQARDLWHQTSGTLRSKVLLRKKETQQRQNVGGSPEEMLI